MPKSETIRRKLDEVRKELDELQADLATVTARRHEAEGLLTKVVRSSDVADAKREGAVHRHAVAQRLVDAQHASIHELQAEIQQLERDLIQQEVVEARAAAERRLHETVTRLEELGRSFRDVIEAPQRRTAEAIADALEAHEAARAHGVEGHEPRLTRYVHGEDFPSGARGWLTETLSNIDRLARNTLRERRRAHAEANADEIEAKERQRVRAARMKMLRRLRERGRRDEHTRRQELEAEVGAELDAELAAEAAA